MTSDFGWDDKINGHPINLGGKKKTENKRNSMLEVGELEISFGFVHSRGHQFHTVN